MRVISQGGHADLPYEEIAVCMASEDIIARHNDKEYLMARYSTMEKAQKAMEMLRETYLSRMELDGGYDMVNRCYVQPNFWVLPKVFQFPKDEDVEVENET